MEKKKTMEFRFFSSKCPISLTQQARQAKPDITDQADHHGRYTELLFISIFPVVHSL